MKKELIFRKTEYLLLDLLGDGDKLRLFECSFLQHTVKFDELHYRVGTEKRKI